jgi:hypothetical protein
MQSASPLKCRDSEAVSLFRELSDQLCQTLSRYGIPFRAYQSPALPLFSKLDQAKQQLILTTLQETLAVYAESEGSGESLTDTKRVLWRTLSRMKLPPQADILDHIEDGDVVEVYLTDFFQVFRNLNFFRYFSCTFEELVSCPIPELGTFEPHVLAYLFEAAQKLSAGEYQHTFKPPLAPYILQETVGVARYRIEITLKHFSPILEAGRGKAMIAVNRSRIVGEGAI